MVSLYFRENLWKEYMQCAKEEKLSCLPLIDEIAGVAERARTEGLLAFEKSMNSFENPLLRAGLELCVDGVDKITIRNYLTDMIFASDTTGAALLRQYIIVSGILDILNGDNPRLIRRHLTMVLGVEAYEDATRAEREATKKRKHGKVTGADKLAAVRSEFTDEFWEQYVKEEKEKYTANASFEDIAQFDDRTIQRILREVRNSEMTVALKICSDEIKNAFFRNISRRLREIAKSDMEIMGPVRARDVQEAQERIVKVVQKLLDEGEIMPQPCPASYMRQV